LEALWCPLKLLITGASGLLGSKLAKAALIKNIQVYAGYNKNFPVWGMPVPFDVSDKNQVKNIFELIKPDVVVHAASLTDVDKCEFDKELAWRINVDGAANIAQFASKTRCFLVYISTDYVFNGKKSCNKENDQTEPLNYYGLTKLEAEKDIQLLMSNCCIARTSVIYGATPATGKINFALWLLKKLQNNEKVQIATDQYNSPTLNTNLVDMILDVIEQRLSGIFHLCGASRVSRYDFALMFAKIFNLNDCLIEPVSASYFKWSATRPADSSLDVSKTQRLLHIKPLELASALTILKQELENKPYTI
jgi:dTDP-4-dehydrorhamnose reductase